MVGHTLAKRQSHNETLSNGDLREFGGARRDRTADLNTASVALSQLSYGPKSKTANSTSRRGWCQGGIRFGKVWIVNLGGKKCLVNYC